MGGRGPSRWDLGGKEGTEVKFPAHRKRGISAKRYGSGTIWDMGILGLDSYRVIEDSYTVIEGLGNFLQCFPQIEQPTRACFC